MTTNTPAPAPQELPDFHSPEVQAVYETLCGIGPPPAGQHWEGWVSRHIVLALSKLRAPVVDEPDDLSEAYRMVKDDRAMFPASTMRKMWELKERYRLALASAPVADVKDWRIDTSAGGPILVYKDCSVIESEQAEYVLRLIAADQASAPVADESPMAKMADALREKARQEQQAYQDRRNQATEWGSMPEGTEADRPIPIAPAAHVAGDETSRYLEWAKDRSAWEMPVGTPVYYSALASAPVADARVAEHVETLRRMRADYKPSDGPMSTLKAAALDAALSALASAPASEDGLTAKQAWWAGYRAGKGLPPDTPRQDAVKVDISSARLVTHWPNGTPRDERDTASDPEGKLIHDPTEPLLAASAPVAGEAYQGDSVAERLDNMADDQPPGSQAQSDLYAAATIWRKHIAHRAAPQASECECARKSEAVADSEAEL